MFPSTARLDLWIECGPLSFSEVDLAQMWVSELQCSVCDGVAAAFCLAVGESLDGVPSVLRCAACGQWCAPEDVVERFDELELSSELVVCAPGSAVPS